MSLSLAKACIDEALSNAGHEDRVSITLGFMIGMAHAMEFEYSNFQMLLQTHIPARRPQFFNPGIGQGKLGYGARKNILDD